MTISRIKRFIQQMDRNRFLIERETRNIILLCHKQNFNFNEIINLDE